MHALIDTWRRRIQVTLALGVALLSVAVLVIGWGAGLEVLGRVKATYAAMVPTTAACFCLIAIAVIQAHLTAANRVWRVRIPLLLVVILVGLNLVIVTENARDFRALAAKADIHPGMILLPCVGRALAEPLLRAAIEHLEALGDPGDVLVNHVLYQRER